MQVGMPVRGPSWAREGEWFLLGASQSCSRNALDPRLEWQPPRGVHSPETRAGPRLLIRTGAPSLPTGELRPRGCAAARSTRGTQPYGEEGTSFPLPIFFLAITAIRWLAGQA